MEEVNNIFIHIDDFYSRDRKTGVVLSGYDAENEEGFITLKILEKKPGDAGDISEPMSRCLVPGQDFKGILYTDFLEFGGEWCQIRNRNLTKTESPL